MNIIIPMAGMGKRMRPHTLTTAKPLIPIAGKPIVQRLVEDIAATCNEKLDEIAYVINPAFGKETEQLLLEVADSLGAKGKIYYQDEPLGTAHAILAAKEALQGNVFIAFADTLIKAEFTIDTGKDAIIWTQRVKDPSQFGVVRLAEDGAIIELVEKPKEFVSDLAIIGIYYFKDGENLRNELQYLIDNNIQEKGEYQLTNAMEHMRNKGIKFYCDQVEEWLDCGNKDATVYTNQRILEIKNGKEVLKAASHKSTNSIIIEPCFIGENVEISNSVIGPHVSLEANSKINGSVISNSIVRNDTIISNAHITNSLIGKSSCLKGCPDEYSLGDFSCVE
ncbi:MAG: nucleotidyltransferase [Bacteroidetes bacterium 47-18]|nr:MAG: nucleotidyltransferase [Bacteroidetes bacterium 47-18]